MAGIIAIFVIPSIVAGIVNELGSEDLGRWMVLLSPTSVLAGVNGFFFHVPVSSGDGGFVPFISDWAYLAAAGLGIAGSVVLAIRRFVRLTV